MIKVVSVTKRFGDVSALEDIDFEVEEGEFVFIMGPSGAGKTTIIKLLLRELIPDKGQIYFDKVDITKLREKEIPSFRQKIGVVFQDFKLLAERTVRENVEVPLAVIGIPQSEWKGRDFGACRAFKKVRDVSLPAFGRRASKSFFGQGPDSKSQADNGRRTHWKPRLGYFPGYS